MRGQGRVFRPKARGRETVFWWLDYSNGGTRHREPAHTASRSEAQRLLRQRLTEREAGKVIGRPDRVTFQQLRELAERQYQLDGRRSLDRLNCAFEHLQGFLGTEAKAQDITAARLDAYAAQRLPSASRATVNYELAAMRKAFRLAIAKGLLASMPAIRLPRVHNARQGFFDDGDFAALVLELPADIQPLIRFLRLTGWRRSEALGLTWSQVDTKALTIRLAAADTKAGEPRVFPYGLAPELKQLLGQRWKKRNGPFVFHRAGQKIGVGALRSAWKRAAKRADLEGASSTTSVEAPPGTSGGPGCRKARS